MSYREYRFTMFVRVTDRKALFRAAYKRMIDDRMEHKTAKEHLMPGGEIDVEACLRMLADPGQSFPGTEILDSACEGTYSPSQIGDGDAEDMEDMDT